MDQEERKIALENKRWLIRRRISLVSFALLIALTIFYAASGLILTQEQADVLKQFNSITITLIGFYSGIVMVYMGAVTYSDTVKDGIKSFDIKVDK